MNGTLVYGYSDNQVKFEGDFQGKFVCNGWPTALVQGKFVCNGGPTALVIVSDGTLLSVKIRHNSWYIDIKKGGTLLKSLHWRGDLRSEMVEFNPGIKWAFAIEATEDTTWESVS